MTTNIKLSLAFAAAALCVSALAAAQEDPMAKSPTQSQSTSQSAAAAPAPSNDAKSIAQVKFDALDANHDGYIDKQEAAVSKPLLNEFAKIDANKDSKLSLIEFRNVKDLASIKVKATGDSYQQ
jgi:hypothetical protein